MASGSGRFRRPHVGDDPNPALVVLGLLLALASVVVGVAPVRQDAVQTLAGADGGHDRGRRRPEIPPEGTGRRPATTAKQATLATVFVRHVKLDGVHFPTYLSHFVLADCAAVHQHQQFGRILLGQFRYGKQTNQPASKEE